jgi:hypothetical protein
MVAIMAVLGVAGFLTIAVGLAEFVHFEPVGQQSGLRAAVKGIFPYDPKTMQVGSSPRSLYKPDQPFAAVVEWDSLPAGTLVGAHWYGGDFAFEAGGFGPATAGDMKVAHRIVPTERTPEGKVPAERYVFVVERYAGGRPVEVLARSRVEVSDT